MSWGRFLYLLTAWMMTVGASFISLYAAVHAPSDYWRAFDLFMCFVACTMVLGVAEETAEAVNR